MMALSVPRSSSLWLYRRFSFAVNGRSMRKVNSSFVTVLALSSAIILIDSTRQLPRTCAAVHRVMGPMFWRVSIVFDSPMRVRYEARSFTSRHRSATNRVGENFENLRIAWWDLSKLKTPVTLRAASRQSVPLGREDYLLPRRPRNLESLP